MIVPLEPRLEGLAERRFFSFARQMLDHQAAGDSERISSLVEVETSRASGLSDLEGQRDAYAACVRVLGDLAQLRWKLVESGYGLELHSPRRHGERISDPDKVRRHKEGIRKELRPRLLEQFSDASVRKFISRMENPSASSKRKSIRMLIADGAELQRRLASARQIPADDPARIEALRCAVRPYLQLVDADLRDDHTGLLLRDIWRYFRYTWSIPQTPIPGRKLLYLVRDAAHEARPIIGIAALSNCAVQLVPRDNAIGWSNSGLVSALTALFSAPDQRAAHEASDPALQFQGIYQCLRTEFQSDRELSPTVKRTALRRVADWLFDGISSAINEIDRQGLATDEEIAAPTPEVVERLRNLSREFASRRQEALAGQGDGDVGISAESIYSDIPVEDDVLSLEPKHSSNAPVQGSRRMLIRKKRASELARLLDARRILTVNRDALTNPSTALVTIEADEVRTAINSALSAIKSRSIGTNLLEITTCGAVAPYNRVLGGKLVALLLLSPQVAADNLRRYGDEPTIIRSQLKNTRVVPDNTLVWLGTTSLFSHGSSQYERLRLPAGVIAPDQPEIRYTYLGNTSGYGTVQFADNTVRALDEVLRIKRGYRDVNSIFGEGASPRLRKLRSGLDAIGFNAEVTMLHHQARRIYGAPLFPQAGAYLCGLGTEPPSYVASPGSHTEATERIAEYWRRRWLSSRLAHDASWEVLGGTPPRLLSASIPSREPTPHDTGEGGSAGGGSGDHDDESRLEFWRRLARAGPNAVSEGLTDSEFEDLHLQTPLEDYLLERARAGLSIILTGNAGDGKTHLARALQRRLEQDADRFEFAFDATAIMNSAEGVAPIVERWREAQTTGKHMVLAINQYPLYELRKQLRGNLPDVSKEIERQWDTRLTAGPNSDSANGGALLLVDLSLRNPLSRDFASRVLDKMLGDPALRRYAANREDSNFSSNFERLSERRIQDRLFDLFDRVISSGQRTTVRELWILTARLLFRTAEDEEPPGVARAWYSERLFAADSRFPLCEALRSVADPVAVSHPHIDRRLETPQGTRQEEWLSVGEPPAPLPSPASAISPSSGAGDNYRDRFLALKRRFYFEHVDGGKQVFRLDPSSDARFHEILREPERDFPEHLGLLIEAINSCYFPHRFEGVREKLCLWIGHRLDEQPTKSFLAREYVPSHRLAIRRPEPPGDLRDALAYAPDHLILCAAHQSDQDTKDVALRIDAALFRTLLALTQGLPRHLVNLGELNRLDTFIDRLRSTGPSVLPELLIYNAKHVTSSAVQISSQFDHYVRARRL